MSTAPTSLQSPGRATPLPPDDRRSMIVDAVLPLLLENGRDVTSRQLAEAAGVAEGTIFRAFGDKETLLKAAVARYLDPAPLLCELGAIDPSEPLENKVRCILVALRRRFEGVFRVMSALREEDRPAPVSVKDDIARLVAAALAPDSERLGWSPEQVAQLARLVAFSSSFPLVTAGSEFTDDELTDLMLYGITGAPGTGTDGKTHAR